MNTPLKFAEAALTDHKTTCPSSAVAEVRESGCASPEREIPTPSHKDVSRSVITPEPKLNQASKSKEDMRSSIMKLEKALLAAPEIQVHLEPKHYFAPGLYLRELAIPRDVTLTGAIHKTEHICILSQGEVSVWTDEGMKRIKAPAVVHSQPGIKRVLYAHEDALWTNIHHNPTNERDLKKIEEIYTAETFEALEAHFETLKLEGGK